LPARGEPERGRHAFARRAETHTDDLAGGVTTICVYDYQNRLTGVDVGGAVVASHTQDALDRRIGSKDNRTQTWVPPRIDWTLRIG
jgi:hypothetical protein